MASLEYNVEGVILALVAPEQSAGGRLFGVPAIHHESNSDAALDQVVVKAEAFDHQTEGLQARNVTATILYASGTATPSEADARAAAIVEKIYAPTASLAAFTELSYFCVEPASSTRREDGSKTRKRIITIPILAKLAA